jgi:hypothetical protein
MSWDEHKRRRVALTQVLQYAQQEPTAGLPWAQLPDVRDVFGDRSDLILALQYRWSQALWSRIELLSMDFRQPSDASALARLAWTQCAAANPTLRRLLDEHLDECGRSVDAVREREQDLMMAGAETPSAQTRRYLSPHVA